MMSFNFGNNADKHYLTYLFQIIDLPSLAQTGALPSINASDLESLLISQTLDVEEQQIIGQYFRNIDNLIAEVGRELERLEKMKVASIQKMFPRPGSSTPEIRFSGFSGEWKVYTLGHLAEKINTKNSSMKFNETFTCSAEYGIVSQKEYFDHNISKSDKLGGYLIVEPNTFVYNPRISSSAPYGPIIRNKLNRTGVISPLYTLFAFHATIDFSFLDWYFKTSLWHNFMLINGDSGARHDRFTIKTDIFFKMPILIPSLAEQRAIGEYFRNLDALIAAKRQKIAKLRNIKAACLDKMFVNTSQL